MKLNTQALNTEQLRLDFEARRHARAGDPGTSHRAAAMAGELARGHCERILAVLRGSAGMTADVIAERVGLSAHQVNKRLPDLKQAGLAEPTGEIGKSRSNRPARLWRAT